MPIDLIEDLQKIYGAEFSKEVYDQQKMEQMAYEQTKVE